MQSTRCEQVRTRRLDGWWRQTGADGASTNSRSRRRSRSSAPEANARRPRSVSCSARRGFRPRNTRRSRGGRRQVRGGRRSLSTSSAVRLAHPGLAAGVAVAPAAAAAARVAEDDEALRPDGGHGDRRRDQAAPQSLDLQRDALRAAGVDDAVNLYHDLASGVRDDRPGLDSCPRPNPRGNSTSRVSSSTSQTPRGRPAAAAATGLATTDHCGRTSEDLGDSRDGVPLPNGGRVNTLRHQPNRRASRTDYEAAVHCVAGEEHDQHAHFPPRSRASEIRRPLNQIPA